MCKATIFLILTVCLLAQCYEISKNYYDEPCFEKESADARDTDYKVSYQDFKTNRFYMVFHRIYSMKPNIWEEIRLPTVQLILTLFQEIARKLKI